MKGNRLMDGSRNNRINVFNELTKPKGTFDYEKCCKLLGDNYDSFVNFCEAIKLIPEEIDCLEVQSFDNVKHTAFFSIMLLNGERIDLEK